MMSTPAMQLGGLFAPSGDTDQHPAPPKKVRKREPKAVLKKEAAPPAENPTTSEVVDKTDQERETRERLAEIDEKYELMRDDPRAWL